MPSILRWKIWAAAPLIGFASALLNIFPETAAAKSKQTNNSDPGADSRIVLEADTADDSLMAQAVEVIRRRFDGLNLREAMVAREGPNRIVVQVPGLQDPTALKALLGKTAKLEFRLVDDDADPKELAQGHVPAGHQILPTKDGRLIAVKQDTFLSGDRVVDAQVTFEESGMPVVLVRFDTAGKNLFAKATQDNVGKSIAVVLDDRVLSAPRVMEPILGGEGVIAGSLSMEEANQLTLLLHSGELPVKLTVVTERMPRPNPEAETLDKRY